MKGREDWIQAFLAVGEKKECPWKKTRSPRGRRSVRRILMSLSTRVNENDRICYGARLSSLVLLDLSLPLRGHEIRDV